MHGAHLKQGHPDASDEGNYNFKKNDQPTFPFYDASSKSCGSLQLLQICQGLGLAKKKNF